MQSLPTTTNYDVLHVVYAYYDSWVLGMALLRENAYCARTHATKTERDWTESEDFDVQVGASQESIPDSSETNGVGTRKQNTVCRHTWRLNAAPFLR